MLSAQNRSVIRLASLALAAISLPVLIVVGGAVGTTLFAVSLVVLAVAVATSPSSLRSLFRETRVVFVLGVLSIAGILVTTFAPGIPDELRQLLATGVFGLVIVFLASLMLKTAIKFRTARSRQHSS